MFEASLLIFKEYYTIAIVVLGSSIMGAIAGAVGVFALLRKESLLGDTMSHAAFPGIAMMFLITGSTDPFILNIGGACAGCFGTLLIVFFLRKTTIKRDTLLGIILSAFFGFGIVLKTVIQKYALPNQAVLGKFFFGNASTLLASDLKVLVCAALVIALILILFWKEFIIVAFDREFAYSIGYPIFFLDIVVTFVIVASVVIGLHIVGVLLMSALLIAPAAAARQWTQSIKNMLWLAIFFGVVSSAGGALISNTFEQVPTGPSIVIIMSLIVVFSLICGTRRDYVKTMV